MSSFSFYSADLISEKIYLFDLHLHVVSFIVMNFLHAGTPSVLNQPKSKHLGDLKCTYRKRPGFHIALLLPWRSFSPVMFLYVVWQWGAGPLFLAGDPPRTAATWLCAWQHVLEHICPTAGLFLDDHRSPACALLIWAWGTHGESSPNGTKVVP